MEWGGVGGRHNSKVVFSMTRFKNPNQKQQNK